MKFAFAAIALMAAGASAQTSTTTVLAPCGTSCPSPPPDVLITRSFPTPTGTAPCPSLIVSSIAMNGTKPSVTTGKPPASTFTGAAMPTAGPAGLVAMVAGAAVAAFAL